MIAAASRDFPLTWSPLEQVFQSLLGVFCVGIVMVVHFQMAPFIRDHYDRIDALGCSLQATTFLLGISTYADNAAGRRTSSW